MFNRCYVTKITRFSSFLLIHLILNSFWTKAPKTEKKNRKQVGSQRTDFHENWYLKNFRKSVPKIQVTLKQVKNKGYMKTTEKFFNHISLNSSQTEKYFRKKGCRENQNSHMFNNFFFLNLTFYEIMWKNIVRPERRMRSSCWVPKATNTLTYLFTYLPHGAESFLRS